MLAREFGDVALQMLRTDLVEGAFVRPLEHAPERLYAVGMGHAIHVLADRVIDRLMLELGHPVVCSGFIRVEDRTRLDVLPDEALEGLAVRGADHLGPDFVALPVLHANNRRLSNRSPAHEFLALGLAHVPALPADIGFVNLNRPVKLVVAILGPCLPDTVQHEPSRFLRNPEVPVQLHGRNRLQVGQAKVDRNRPLAHRHIRARDRRPGADGEVGPAVLAPVGHRLRVRNFACPRATTLRTVAPVRPNRALEPRRGRFLARKQVHQLNDGNPFAVRFSWCFLRHLRSPFRHSEYRYWSR